MILVWTCLFENYIQEDVIVMSYMKDVIANVVSYNERQYRNGYGRCVIHNRDF